MSADRIENPPEQQSWDYERVLKDFLKEAQDKGDESRFVKCLRSILSARPDKELSHILKLDPKLTCTGYELGIWEAAIAWALEKGDELKTLLQDEQIRINMLNAISSKMMFHCEKTEHFTTFINMKEAYLGEKLLDAHIKNITLREFLDAALTAKRVKTQCLEGLAEFAVQSHVFQDQVALDELMSYVSNIFFYGVNEKQVKKGTELDACHISQKINLYSKELLTELLSKRAEPARIAELLDKLSSSSVREHHEQLWQLTEDLPEFEQFCQQYEAEQRRESLREELLVMLRIREIENFDWYPEADFGQLRARFLRGGIFSGFDPLDWGVFKICSSTVLRSIPGMLEAREAIEGLENFDLDQYRRELLAKLATPEMENILKRDVKQDYFYLNRGYGHYEIINNLQEVYFTKEPTDINDLEELKLYHEGIGSVLDAIDATKKQYLACTQFVQMLERVWNFFFSRWQKFEEEFTRQERQRVEQEVALKKEQEAKEKMEKLTRLRQHYLEQQIDYLWELYQLGTGLDFPGTPGQLQCSNTGEIGSVVRSVSPSVGMSLSPRLEMSLSMELKGILDGIFLEVGEELELLEQRAKLMNFVIPHEIGHLVDDCQDGLFEKFFAEVLQNNTDLQDLVAGDDLKEEYFRGVLKESVIDGIALQLALKHGTTRVHDKTPVQRLRSVMESMTATLEVLSERVTSEATEEDSEEYHCQAKLLRVHGITVSARIIKQKAGELDPEPGEESVLTGQLANLLKHCNKLEDVCGDKIFLKKKSLVGTRQELYDLESLMHQFFQFGYQEFLK